MDLMATQASVAWQGHEGPRLARVKGYDVIDCRGCGFRHAVPLPDPGALERTYRETYYTEDKPDFLARSGEDQSWAELAQRQRLESFERLLAPERRRLLDIGCGPGFFLATAQQRGWQVKGIEPSRQAAAHARSLGIAVMEGFFNAETARALGRFDAVNLNNVLEHVPDPIGVVTAAGDVLDQDGVICINVPNDFTPFQRAAGAVADTGEWWIVPPHHLNYFDFDTAESLLTRLGFKAVERTTSFPMEMFLLMGENYTRDDALGRRCHALRKRFDLAFEAAGLEKTRRDFYRALAAAGIGREAVVIAVKP